MSKLALTLIVVCCVGLAAWGETVRFKEYREGETVEYGFTSAVFNDTGICVSGGIGNRRGVNGDGSAMIHGQGYIALVQVRDLLTLDERHFRTVRCPSGEPFQITIDDSWLIAGRPKIWIQFAPNRQ